MKQNGFYVVRKAGAELTGGVEPPAMQHYKTSKANAAGASDKLSPRDITASRGAGTRGSDGDICPKHYGAAFSEARARQCERHAKWRNFLLKKFWNGATSLEPLVKPRKAFTLAEILLTLAVIGIVAAITLPSLMVDTTEKAFDAQRAALHARLTQAIGMMANLSGYGEYTANETGDTLTDTAAETFLYEGLSKVYKMNNICAYDGTSATSTDILNKCNIPSKITTMKGDEINFPTTLKSLNNRLITSNITDFDKKSSASDKSMTNTKVAAFETVNGESVAVFYNPSCRSDVEAGPNVISYGDTGENAGKTYDYFYIQNRMCVNFIYDLNGLKGPNKVGKDVGFITALYDKNPEVVAPMPFTANVDNARYTHQEAINKCIAYADNSRLPNKHEASSLFYNMNLIGNYQEVGYWTSSVASPFYGWDQSFYNGVRYKILRSDRIFVRCIRK